MKGIRVLIATLAIALFTTAGAGVALADPPIGCTPDNCTIIDFFQDGTQANFWKTYDGNNFETCEKVSTSDTPITLTDSYAFLVIHSGAHYYIWEPAPAGDYSAFQTTSFYVVCDKLPGEEEIVAPKGYIGGPCADPAYYGIFDNTESTVAVWFRFTWFTASGQHRKGKVVPAGAIYRTWEHWSKPGTRVRVLYKDPDTGLWTVLASTTAVRGRYPACVYHRGWEYPQL